jgi:NitT/TauT family transport system ATP-binding protein
MTPAALESNRMDGAVSTDPHELEFRDVSKTFTTGSRTVHSLRDFSLRMPANEFVTLVGPSGCGKSTALNIAAGLLEPSAGHALLGGQPIHGPDAQRGVIFQQYALFPWLTVRANIEFALRLRGVPRATRAAEAIAYLELVGLADFAAALPKELSGGMRQRCAIARAYAAEPKILLMDEPFGALDALTRVQLQEQLLETWQREKRTVLFITHDVDEAVYLADRVVVMTPSPGRIKSITHVDLARPRTEQMRLSDHFAQLRNEVWSNVHHQ